MTPPATAGRTGGPPVLAEVDLDTAPESSPSHRRPLLAAATVVAVLTLVAAAALRSEVSGPPAPPAPAVTAWVSLRSVAPAADGTAATADLVVTVANHGSGDRTVSGLAVGGPRSAGAATTLEPPRTDTRGATSGTLPLVVPAAGIGLLAAREPLACTGKSGSGSDLDVRLTLDGGDVVTAVPVGALAGADGVCAAVRTATPDGAASPVDVVSARFSGRTAQLRVSGLPAGATVLGVGAGGWVVPLLDGATGTAGPATPRTLTLGRPVQSCEDTGSRGVVPVGLQLRVSDGGPPVTRYADVGPDLVRWLVDARAATCDGAG